METYEDNTMNMPVLVYGIVANALVFLPWIFYIAQKDDDLYAQYHMTYI